MRPLTHTMRTKTREAGCQLQYIHMLAWNLPTWVYKQTYLSASPYDWNPNLLLTKSPAPSSKLDSKSIQLMSTVDHDMSTIYPSDDT